MFRNILIPVALDHETDLEATLAIVRGLRAPEAQITLVGVLEEVPAYVAEYVTIRPDTGIAPALRTRLNDLAAAHGGLAVAVLTGKPGVAIAELAERSGADLIVIRSHRPGMQDYFLGSTASRVVRRAPCAVLVLR